VEMLAILVALLASMLTSFALAKLALLGAFWLISVNGRENQRRADRSENWFCGLQSLGTLRIFWNTHEPMDGAHRLRAEAAQVCLFGVRTTGAATR
jgi:hypothetical protein